MEFSLYLGHAQLYDGGEIAIHSIWLSNENTKDEVSFVQGSTDGRRPIRDLLKIRISQDLACMKGLNLDKGDENITLQIYSDSGIWKHLETLCEGFKSSSVKIEISAIQGKESNNGRMCHIANDIAIKRLMNGTLSY